MSKRIVRLALVALVCVQPARAGEWTEFNVTGPLSGLKGKAARVTGVVDDVHGSRAARLVVSCTDNSTSVFMSADFLVFGGDVARAEYSIDGGPAQAAYWNVCAGDLCAGLWGGAGIPFLRSLLDARLLKMTLTRHFGGPIRATFPVEGARDALKEVGRQCGWMPRD